MGGKTDKTPRIARGVTASLAALLAVVPAARSVADPAGCQPLFDAMTRLFKTPSHQYLKQTDTRTGDKAVDSEIINTGKAMYVMVGGRWNNSPITAGQLQEQEEQNRRNAKVTTCHVVREESFDGVATTLFSAHTETGYGASDQQLWIAKDNGLPLREIIEMDMGDHGGKSRAEIHVVYSGVEAPVVSP
jgi:hypothetical protein